MILRNFNNSQKNSKHICIWNFCVSKAKPYVVHHPCPATNCSHEYYGGEAEQERLPPADEFITNTSGKIGKIQI